MPIVEIENPCPTLQAAGACKAVTKATGAEVRKVKHGTWEVEGGDEKKAVKYLECVLQKGVVMLAKGDDEGDFDCVWVPQGKVAAVLDLNGSGDVLVFVTKWGQQSCPDKTVQIGVFGQILQRIDAIFAICSLVADIAWLRKVGFYNLPHFKPLQKNFAQTQLDPCPSRLKAKNILATIRDASGCDFIRLVANTFYTYSENTKAKRCAVNYLTSMATSIPAEGSVVLDLPSPMTVEKYLSGITGVLCYSINEKQACLASRAHPLSIYQAKYCIMKHIENKISPGFYTSHVVDEKSPSPTLATDTFTLLPLEIVKLTPFRRKIDHFYPSGHLAIIGKIAFISGDKEYRKTVRHALADFLEELHAEREKTPMQPKKKRKTSKKKKKK